MREVTLTGCEASNPLGFLAALGTLRVVARSDPSARLRWVREGRWLPAITLAAPDDLSRILLADLERWRTGHPALDFAEGADRKIQDLKHPPDEFRLLMGQVAHHAEAAAFVAAYATGVAVDGTGQTKPTSFHFTAGQQRFLDAVLTARDAVAESDLKEALFGPWVGRQGPKDTRWQASYERSRALLPFDPSGEKARVVVGAVWLAFQALPFFPTAPVGARVVTTGFAGRGRRERFTWPVWNVALGADEIRVAVGLAGLDDLTHLERSAMGIATVFQARVVRSSQGYGSFSAAKPL
ncbi:MAG: hypothetical protein RJQ04_17035 [Longimicrobiales bacterium]